MEGRSERCNTAAFADRQRRMRQGVWVTSGNFKCERTDPPSKLPKMKCNLFNTLIVIVEIESDL